MIVETDRTLKPIAEYNMLEGNITFGLRIKLRQRISQWDVSLSALSQQPNYLAPYAYDSNKFTSCWKSLNKSDASGNFGTAEWLLINTHTSPIINQIKVYNYNLKTFVIVGSNDLISFTVLEYAIDNTATESIFSFAEDVSYQYYGFYIYSINIIDSESSAKITEIVLYRIIGIAKDNLEEDDTTALTIRREKESDTGLISMAEFDLTLDNSQGNYTYINQAIRGANTEIAIEISYKKWDGIGDPVLDSSWAKEYYPLLQGFLNTFELNANSQTLNIRGRDLADKFNVVDWTSPMYDNMTALEIIQVLCNHYNHLPEDVEYDDERPDIEIQENAKQLINTIFLDDVGVGKAGVLWQGFDFQQQMDYLCDGSFAVDPQDNQIWYVRDYSINKLSRENYSLTTIKNITFYDSDGYVIEPWGCMYDWTRKNLWYLNSLALPLPKNSIVKVNVINWQYTLYPSHGGRSAPYSGTYDGTYLWEVYVNPNYDNPPLYFYQVSPDDYSIQDTIVIYNINNYFHTQRAIHLIGITGKDKEWFILSGISNEQTTNNKLLFYNKNTKEIKQLIFTQNLNTPNYKGLLFHDVLLVIGVTAEYPYYKYSFRKCAQLQFNLSQANIQPGTVSIQYTDPKVTINDGTIGTENNKFYFSSNWNYVGHSPAYCEDIHHSNVNDSYFQISFHGNQINLYSTKSSIAGIMAVSIDGDTEVDVDCYSSSEQNQVLVYSSPILSKAQHTIKGRVTNRKNINSTNYYIYADRADIYMSDIVVDNIADTDKLQLDYETGELRFFLPPANTTKITAKYDYLFSIPFCYFEDQSLFECMQKIAETKGYVLSVSPGIFNMEDVDNNEAKLIFKDNINERDLILKKYLVTNKYQIKDANDNPVTYIIPDLETVTAYNPDKKTGVCGTYIKGIDYEIDYITGQIWWIEDSLIKDDEVITIVFYREPVFEFSYDSNMTSLNMSWGRDQIINKVTVEGERRFPAAAPLITTAIYAVTPDDKLIDTKFENVKQLQTISTKDARIWKGYLEAWTAKAYNRNLEVEFDNKFIGIKSTFDGEGNTGFPDRRIRVKVTPVDIQSETGNQIGQGMWVNWVNYGGDTSDIQTNKEIIETFPSTTSLRSNISAINTIIPVVSTIRYPPTGGAIIIDNEKISYTGITTGIDSTFTGCVRGIDGTTSASHTTGAIVTYDPTHSKVNVTSLKVDHRGMQVEVDNLTDQIYFLKIDVQAYPIHLINKPIATHIDYVSKDKYGLRTKNLQNQFLTDLISSKWLARHIIKLNSVELPQTAIEVLGSAFIELGDIVKVREINSKSNGYFEVIKTNHSFSRNTFLTDLDLRLVKWIDFS